MGHLRAQLVGLKLRALIKKAEELGLPEEEIDAASEAGQEQIVELLLSAMLRAEEAELRAELESLSLRKLLARSEDPTSMYSARLVMQQLVMQVIQVPSARAWALLLWARRAKGRSGGEGGWREGGPRSSTSRRMRA